MGGCISRTFFKFETIGDKVSALMSTFFDSFKSKICLRNENVSWRKSTIEFRIPCVPKKADTEYFSKNQYSKSVSPNIEHSENFKIDQF